MGVPELMKSPAPLRPLMGLMSGIVFAIFVAVLPRNISALNKAQDWAEGIERNCGTLLGLWFGLSTWPGFD